MLLSRCLRTPLGERRKTQILCPQSARRPFARRRKSSPQKIVGEIQKDKAKAVSDIGRLWSSKPPSGRVEWPQPAQDGVTGRFLNAVAPCPLSSHDTLACRVIYLPAQSARSTRPRAVVESLHIGFLC